jgi:hypothetical protein
LLHAHTHTRRRTGSHAGWLCLPVHEWKTSLFPQPLPHPPKTTWTRQITQRALGCSLQFGASCCHPPLDADNSVCFVGRCRCCQAFKRRAVSRRRNPPCPGNQLAGNLKGSGGAERDLLKKRTTAVRKKACSVGGERPRIGSGRDESDTAHTYVDMPTAWSARAGYQTYTENTPG